MTKPKQTLEEHEKNCDFCQSMKPKDKGFRIYNFHYPTKKDKMEPKEKAIKHLKLEQEWIVHHKLNGAELISEETSYHPSTVVEEAIDIAIEETKKLGKTHSEIKSEKKSAKQCCDFKGLECDNKDCKNWLCPLKQLVGK